MRIAFVGSGISGLVAVRRLALDRRPLIGTPKAALLSPCQGSPFLCSRRRRSTSSAASSSSSALRGGRAATIVRTPKSRID
jgi:hypothetical protein